MIGDNLLVAPVLSETDQSKKLYLPEGEWLDWWSNKTYEGRQWLTVEAPLSKIPLFMRAGAVIPVRDVQEYTGEKELTELGLSIFPSEKSTYSFYEDDGTSYKYKDGGYSITQITCQRNNKRCNISLDKLKSGFETKLKSYLLKVYTERKPSRVLIDKRQAEEFTSPDKMKNSEGYYFDEKSGTVIIRSVYHEKFEVSVE
jgi:alpha-glucosidase